MRIALHKLSKSQEPMRKIAMRIRVSLNSPEFKVIKSTNERK